MAFMNPMMQQMGGGFPGGGFQGGGMPGGGGGLMGQLGRGMSDGSLVGGERALAGRAVMDEKMTEMAAKMDGVVTPQERMAIMAKKCKASHLMNHLRTNKMGNVSREALARQQGGPGGPGGGFGGPGGGFGGPCGCSHGAANGLNGAQAVGGVGNVSMSAAWSSGGNAQAFAGPQGAFARAF